MKRLIDWLLGRRREAEAAAPSAVSSELSYSDLESYYLRIVVDVLRRMLVPADAVQVNVSLEDASPDQLPTFAGYVKILRWEPIMPVVLQNLPVIDRRVRRIVAASVILENTRFAGLWFQADSTVEGAPEALVGMPSELIRQAQQAGGA